jgi:hypothetical protein
MLHRCCVTKLYRSEHVVDDFLSRLLISICSIFYHHSDILELRSSLYNLLNRHIIKKRGSKAFKRGNLDDFSFDGIINVTNV